MELIVFDMDGTIIEFNLPIEEIKRVLGVRKRILEEILSRDDSDELLRVLESYEIRAAKSSRLYPHVREFLEALENKGITTALYTRNSRRSVEIVMRKHGISFDYVFTREDGIKPSPKPILRLIEEKGYERRLSAMIGDFYFDYLTAKNCGIQFWLFMNGRNEGYIKEFDIKPDLAFKSYEELMHILKL